MKRAELRCDGARRRLRPNFRPYHKAASRRNPQREAALHETEKARLQQFSLLNLAAGHAGCGRIVSHMDAAFQAVAAKKEISEALGIAVAMSAGGALIYSTCVLDAAEAKNVQGPLK